jgi:hypothetical protein
MDGLLFMSRIVNLSTGVHAHTKAHAVSKTTETAAFFGFMLNNLPEMCFALAAGYQKKPERE